MRRVTRHLFGLIIPAMLLAATPGSVPAEVLANDHRQHVVFVEFDACSGEEVLIDTEYHAVTRQEAGKDDVTIFEFRVNAHGTATGQTSGTS